ncbi:hypothetical protein [Fonticella tunisiensis]|uniref:FtsX-like permease family protein n=1 Tax=Fonticella tunisiensis TaxID=1096341 RepID=A0A4R7KRU9_9CLOT|nr:hypothetical protein [Fonticella tunisiensis]TDT58383.1 hypothetical protein EDD71_11117 [Fonticella tunisiensis]
MNRVIKYSILYDYKKLNLRIITIFGLILLSFIIYAGREYVYLNRHVSDTANMWDFYSFVFIDSNILVSVLIFSSLYFIFNSFQNNKKDMFIKIRVNNFLTWFTSKIISNFIFNFISITLATIFALAIGIIISGYGLNWSSVAHRLRVYSKFYNPIEFAGINVSVK